MVHKVIEPGAAGCWVQMQPRSYGGFPIVQIMWWCICQENFWTSASWNKTLWLDVSSHVTGRCNQSERLIWVKFVN